MMWDLAALSPSFYQPCWQWLYFVYYNARLALLKTLHDWSGHIFYGMKSRSEHGWDGPVVSPCTSPGGPLYQWDTAIPTTPLLKPWNKHTNASAKTDHAFLICRSIYIMGLYSVSIGTELESDHWRWSSTCWRTSQMPWWPQSRRVPWQWPRAKGAPRQPMSSPQMSTKPCSVISRTSFSMRWQKFHVSEMLFYLSLNGICNDF